MTHYYVYYRVDAVPLNELCVAVEHLLATIERETGVRGEWLRRRDDAGTYMEVYEGVRDEQRFESVLARAAAGFPVERRLECFVCA